MSKRQNKEWLRANGFAHPNPTSLHRPPREMQHEGAWKFLEQRMGLVRIVDAAGNFRCENYPTMGGRTPSLVDLIQSVSGSYTFRLDKFGPKVERTMRDVIRTNVFGEALAGFIHANDCHIPPERMMGSLARWTEKLADGIPTMLVSIVCPDWETQHGSYTFNGLRDGIGLVAERLIECLPDLWKMFSAQGRLLPVTVAIGDCEGYSEANCVRAGNINFAEFQNRCRGSQQKLRERLITQGIPETCLSTPLTTEMLSRDDWDALLTQGQTKIGREGATVALGISPPDLRAIVEARRSLYERWDGPLSNDALQRKTFDQLVEYGALGAIAQRISQNPLLVQTDHAVMADGFRLFADVPVIYRRTAAY